MTSTRPRILLVEDEAMSRAFLGTLIASAGYEVTECASAAAAARAFAAVSPVAVVTDIDLGDGPNGLDLVVALKRRSPGLAVVILSNYAIAPDRLHAALAGAAYLRKSDLEDPRALLGALAEVLRPGRRHAIDGRQAAGRLAALTDTQAEVLRMIAAGLSNEEIAARRHTTVKSVENMIHRIFLALELTPDPALNMRVAAARVFIRAAGVPPTG